MNLAPKLVDAMPDLDLAYRDPRAAALRTGRDALAALATELVDAGWIPPGAVTELDAGPEPLGWHIARDDPGAIGGYTLSDLTPYPSRAAAEDTCDRLNGTCDRLAAAETRYRVVAAHEVPLPACPADGTAVEHPAGPRGFTDPVAGALADLLHLVPVHDTSDPAQVARARVHLAERAVQLVALLVHPSEVLDAIGRQHATGPVLDPTAYRAALDGLADVESLMASLVPAESLYRAVSAAGQARDGGGQ